MVMMGCQSIQRETIAAWFGQPGGGTFKLPKYIAELSERGKVMTIVQLKRILQKEKINPGDYDILQDRYLKNYDGFIIDKSPKGTWRLYYCERAEYTLLQESTDEDFICREFLRMMAREHKRLAKYV